MHKLVITMSTTQQFTVVMSVRGVMGGMVGQPLMVCTYLWQQHDEWDGWQSGLALGCDV